MDIYKNSNNIDYTYRQVLDFIDQQKQTFFLHKFFCVDVNTAD